MRKTVLGLMAAGVLCSAGLTATPSAAVTGSRIPGNAYLMPEVTLLTRTYRWRWDPFRVDGENAYAVAWITNKHQYSLTLKTYCRKDGKLMRSLSGWHLIAPGKTFEWDTRQLVVKAHDDPKDVVKCRFWIDGTVDMRGQIVNLIPVRMGLEGNPVSLLTFNYANFAPNSTG